MSGYTLADNVENLTLLGASGLAAKSNTTGATITTNTGIDTITGGAGNDTYIVNNISDVITEATGGGNDTVRTSLSGYTLAANVENLTFLVHQD